LIYSQEAYARRRVRSLAKNMSPEMHAKLVLPPKAKEIVVQATVEHGIPSGIIFAKTRNTLLVKIRGEIYQKMKEAGYATAHISRMCKRDYTTILYSLRKNK